MSCEKHGYTNNTFCPACDLETIAEHEKKAMTPSADTKPDVRELMEKLDTLSKQIIPLPWNWNSYSAFHARVPKGDHMDDSIPDDPQDPGYAHILTINQAPRFEDHGDELHDPETKANARFVEAWINAYPALRRHIEQMEAELAELQEKLATLNAGFVKQETWCRDKIAAQEAELVALRADAERYRWLRNTEDWEPIDDRWLSLNNLYGATPEELDAAIDTAIAQEQK